MSQGLLQSHPPVWLVLEHPGDEVEHDALLLPGEAVRTGPPVLRQRPTVLAGVPSCGQRPVPAQPPRHAVEEVCLGPPHDVGGEVAEDPGHHGEVLHVVVRLEQRVALQHHRDKGRNSYRWIIPFTARKDKINVEYVGLEDRGQ